jgi:hypothetical protein
LQVAVLHNSIPGASTDFALPRSFRAGLSPSGCTRAFGASRHVIVLGEEHLHRIARSSRDAPLRPGYRRPARFRGGPASSTSRRSRRAPHTHGPGGVQAGALSRQSTIMAVCWNRRCLRCRLLRNHRYQPRPHQLPRSRQILRSDCPSFRTPGCMRTTVPTADPSPRAWRQTTTPSSHTSTRPTLVRRCSARESRPGIRGSTRPRAFSGRKPVLRLEAAIRSNWTPRWLRSSARPTR